MNNKFTEYFKDLLDPEDYNKFISQINEGKVRTALRVNTLLAKAGIKDIGSDFEKLQNIPWSPNGYFYESVISIGNTECFKSGKVYSQEASSQIAVELLDPKAGDYVLDLCASPGSKTTQIAALVDNEALIIANEISPDRYVKLRNNLKDFGVVSHAITALDSTFFAKNYINTFDKILVDAPCSGEGMYFKFPAVLKHWNIKTIKFNAKRQRKIIEDAFVALKPGGKLVYSTCTLNLEENEKVIAHILKKFFGNAQIVNIDMKKHGLYVKGGGRKTKEPMLKIWPHEFKTGGFFACILTKKTSTESGDSKRVSHLTARQKRQTAHVVEKKNVREGWKLCMKKEEMSIVKALLKQAGLASVDFPKMFAIVKHDGEYYLQTHSFYKRFADLPVRSVGAKVLDKNNKATPEALVWLKTL
ncbi:MAG: RsmB/NOP family class I SAM-dependent RNA methyltransferase [Candidatus Peregrinibacteria bacterium]|nr:RsmB/NOP family class I SAM-dependent RNA methyltransferase [Candidatus Peregrinibacteria bacterium]MDZ4244818.1 RsmB/NOP family class I SAM-dependent RNA methyltransferase [Candidatus Gracilibacteria bacterium]